MGYKDIPIPEDKDPKEYTFPQRRAVIFHEMIKAGHPENIPRKKLSEHFGVSTVQIHKDIQKLKEEISEHIDTDAKYLTRVVLNKAVRDLSSSPDNTDKYHAARLILSWKEWLEPKAPETVKHEGNLLDQVVQEIGIGKKEDKK